MSDTPQHGTFCWNELMTRDAAAAQNFYSQLLGWTSEEMDMADGAKYTMFKAGETFAGGMMQMEGPQFEGVPPHWISYIAVDSVDDSSAKAEQLGAGIHVPPTDIPNIGRFSVIQDPTGAVVCLFQSLANPADCPG